MYESQVVGYKDGRIAIHGGWTPDGEIHEPYDLTLFSPKRGDWTVRMTRPDSMNPNGEFQMYWTRIPDFGIREYDVFPREDGWIAKLVYKGTAFDGTSVTAHQVDFAYTDQQSRVVRMEWYTDQLQWFNVWSAASGKSVDEVRRKVESLDGWSQLIAETIAGRGAPGTAAPLES
jgi:hypothetical protein